MTRSLLLTLCAHSQAISVHATDDSFLPSMQARLTFLDDDAEAKLHDITACCASCCGLGCSVARVLFCCERSRTLIPSNDIAQPRHLLFLVECSLLVGCKQAVQLVFCSPIGYQAVHHPHHLTHIAADDTEQDAVQARTVRRASHASRAPGLDVPLRHFSALQRADDVCGADNGR